MNIFFDLDNLVVAKDEVKKEDIELIQTPDLLQSKNQFYGGVRCFRKKVE